MSSSVARQTMLRQQRATIAPLSSAVRQHLRSLHVSAVSHEQQPKGTMPPTAQSRTSPKTTAGSQHPGYTDVNTPVTSDDPAAMPGPKAGASPASQTRQASTRSEAQHEGIREMSEGAKIGGEDAILPEERNVKNWGPNQRTPEFNQHEGRRNPVLHGGSHEGGHDSKGNSKT